MTLIPDGVEFTTRPLPDMSGRVFELRWQEWRFGFGGASLYAHEIVRDTDLGDNANEVVNAVKRRLAERREQFQQVQWEVLRGSKLENHYYSLEVKR